MPKMLPGVLIKTDKSVRIYIKNLNSGGKNFILKDLDENNLFVKENDVAIYKKRCIKCKIETHMFTIWINRNNLFQFNYNFYNYSNFFIRIIYFKKISMFIMLS